MNLITHDTGLWLVLMHVSSILLVVGAMSINKCL